MKSNNKKYCTIVALIWAACVILFFFVYMLVLEPQRREKKNIANQLAEHKQAYDSAVKAAEEETQAHLTSQVAGLQKRMSDFVVASGDSSNLTFDISETAGQHRIESFSIKSQSGRDSPGGTEFNYISEHRFDVTFAAGLDQFAGFINALERHHPVLLVDTFLITRADRPDQGHKAKLNLTALVGRQKGN